MKVYRLVTRNSYEREMFDRASLKLGLDKAVLQSMSGRESHVGGVRIFSISHGVFLFLSASSFNLKYCLVYFYP